MDLPNGTPVGDATIYHVGTPTWLESGKLLQVGPAGELVRVGKLKTSGMVFADINGYCHPQEICHLAAGKDAWKRNILFRCADCRKRLPAHQMECGMCPECYDKAGEENAALDGGAL